MTASGVVPHDLSAHAEIAAARYAEQRPLFEDYASTVSKILHDALRREGIHVSGIQYRAKDLDSFREKAARPHPERLGRPRYLRPVEDIKDLAGVRVIVRFEEEIEAACAVVEREFRGAQRTKDDRRAHTKLCETFGYQSVHYVARMSSRRCRLPEYARFRHLQAEVQIRTVLHHAWAEIEHDLQYKAANVIDPALRRRFACVAAVLELAGREFEAINLEYRRLHQVAAAEPVPVSEPTVPTVPKVEIPPPRSA